MTAGRDPVTSYPANPQLVLPDAFGLRWSIPDFLVDWSNRLILWQVGGPDMCWGAKLSSFETLPGISTDLLELYLKVENVGDQLEITIQAGRWEVGAASYPIGKSNLYVSACKALIWLRSWRSIATGSMIRVFGLPENLEDPWIGDDWQIGNHPRVELVSCSTSAL